MSDTEYDPDPLPADDPANVAVAESVEHFQRLAWFTAQFVYESTREAQSSGDPEDYYRRLGEWVSAVNDEQDHL